MNQAKHHYYLTWFSWYLLQFYLFISNLNYGWILLTKERGLEKAAQTIG